MDRPLPSERKKNNKVNNEVNEKFKSDMEHIFKVVCSSPEGVRLMKFLKEQCHYQSSTVMLGKDGAISSEGISYKESKRSLYLLLRRYISRESLFKIEL
jgi:hypothetical protein